MSPEEQRIELLEEVCYMQQQIIDGCAVKGSAEYTAMLNKLRITCAYLGLEST